MRQPTDASGLPDQHEANPKPPPDRDACGGFSTGAVRVRPTFFGLAICEELYEHHDGRREWRRSQTAIVISERKE